MEMEEEARLKEHEELKSWVAEVEGRLVTRGHARGSNDGNDGDVFAFMDAEMDKTICVVGGFGLLEVEVVYVIQMIMDHHHHHRNRHHHHHSVDK